MKELDYWDLTAYLRAHDALTNWRAVRDVVRDYYPPSAVRAVVKIGSEYDDENYYNVVECFTVFDQGSNELPYDFASPGWKGFLERHGERPTTRSYERWNERADEWIEQELVDLPHDDLGDIEYDLREEPRLPYAHIYGEE